MRFLKKISFIAGLLALALLWTGPFLSTARVFCCAHVCAYGGRRYSSPLISIGLSARIAVKPFLVLIASLSELFVVWGWHLPAARLWATTSAFATILEQSMFLAAGLFLWLTALASADQSKEPSASGALALLLTSVHMTLPGRPALTCKLSAFQCWGSHVLRSCARCQSGSGTGRCYHAACRCCRLPRRRRFSTLRASVR